jgi:hypothetical protein
MVKFAAKTLGIPADFFPQENPQVISRFLVVFLWWPKYFSVLFMPFK